MKIFKFFFPILLVLISFGQQSCKKMIDIDAPIQNIVAEDVFKDRSTAILAITGMYASMMSPYDMFSGERSLSMRGAVMSDEMDIGPEAYSQLNLYRNNMLSSDDAGFWKTLYSSYVYRINSILYSMETATQIDQKTKDHIVGEAKFLRAFYYFYLINFYGDVPLVLSTDFKINSNIPRSPVSLAYEQIIKDLKEAQSLLTVEYLSADLLSPTAERIRPNRMAATALLARVYLYQKDWANAEIESSKVIENTNYELLGDLNRVFLMNSKETIWALQPNFKDPEGANTPDGRYLIPWIDHPFPNLFASSSLNNAFEAGDLRKTSWLEEIEVGGTKYLIPFKYKMGYNSGDPAEYLVVLRISEQYLIRAEARANLTKLSGANSAESDLNIIRHRAGLEDVFPYGLNEILDAILKERQTELFTEWANRWFDLRRFGKINEVMKIVAPTKITFGIPGIWEPYKALLPIPSDEFPKNPALKGHQNPGYTEQ